MNGKIGLALGIGAIAVGGLLYLAFAPVEDSEERPEARSQRKNAGSIVSDGKAKKSRFADEAGVKHKKEVASARPKPRMREPDDWIAKLPSAKDRALAKRIQDAQDADDSEAVFKAAEDALSSQSAEVRQAAVTALSLQGEAAMQLLLQFVGDADKDVADSAYWAWDDAVDSVESEFRKLDAVKEVLKVAKYEEHIKTALGKIETMDEAWAIRELAELAKDGGKVSAAAKESYENVTGEPFENWAAAELKAMAIDRENKAADDQL